MNRLRTLVGILFVILGLTGLLGCNRGPQKDAIGSLPDLPEASAGLTYQAAYTDIAAELLFADGESLLAAVSYTHLHARQQRHLHRP